MSGHLNVSAKLTLDCTGPEIKGSVSYITPTRITWSVNALGDLGSEPLICVTAIIDGTARDGGRPVGRAYFGLQDPLPEWVERPNMWIALITRLLAGMYGIEADR